MEGRRRRGVVGVAVVEVAGPPPGKKIIFVPKISLGAF